MMQNNAQELWNKFRASSLINRCVQYAEWTIPALFPKQRSQADTVLYDYQSIGAMLVHKLGTKLGQLLFPATSSFFKLNIPALQELSAQEQEALADIELRSTRNLFDNAAYAKLVHALMLLVVTGNALLVRKAQDFRVYSLHNYVLRRDSTGKVDCIVLKEELRRYELGPELIRTLAAENAHPDTCYDLYTVCRWDYERQLWVETQEINGKPVHTEEGLYSRNLCPYIPVVWNLYAGEVYGRGHVEVYAGDFIRLSELSAALGQYEINSANVKILYDPAGQVDVESLSSEEQGLVLQGNPASISAFEGGQYQKIQVLNASIQQIQQRLSQAFMYLSNQREGERVTAYEIQLAAQEAEQALGGVYSQLSYALHLPLAYLLIHEADPRIGAAVADGSIDVRIVTGMQALSRAVDLQQWLYLGQELGTLIPVLQQISPRFNTEAVIDVFMQGHGLSKAGVMLTAEELQARQQELLEQQQQTQRQLRQIQSQDATVEAGEQLGIM